MYNALQTTSEQVLTAKMSCTVETRWLNTAVLNMTKDFHSLPDDTVVTFVFTGAYLCIGYNERRHDLLAKGERWAQRYKMLLEDFKPGPRNLNQEFTDITIWQEKLRIGGNIYAGVEVWAHD